MSQPRDPYQRPYQQQYGGRPQQRQQYAPPPPPPPSRGRRIPGLGLLLTGIGLLIQVLSLTVLPWILVDAKDQSDISLFDLWDLLGKVGTHGFGEWYLVLFSAPLAVLGIVLALAAVLDSVAMKIVWVCLTLAGLGFLVLAYGFWPLARQVVTDNPGEDLTTQEVTTAVIALAAAGVVIFVLKSALSMFRRVAGLILIVLAGVHVAALVDLVKGQGMDSLGIGAYGPALGYVLTAVAVFVTPRKVPGV